MLDKDIYDFYCEECGSNGKVSRGGFACELPRWHINLETKERKALCPDCGLKSDVFFEIKICGYCDNEVWEGNPCHYFVDAEGRRV